ncbi:MAG: hypothetical protein DLD55_01075 [candidate division SR1 bacterium]|nr:MAG: hypothetical protein DLD55_01075 [candidate division SR1 bacterium]
MMELYQRFLEVFQANPWAQTIGFLAVGVNIIAFVTAKDKKFLLFMAISSAIWGLHFYLMGLGTAAGVNFFDVIKNFIALKYKRNLLWISIFLVIYGVIGYFTFDPSNLFSLIPILNAFLSLLFVFYLKGVWLKSGFLLILVLWFVYNFMGQSLGGMTSDVLLFLSGGYGLIRILLQEKKERSV